jgi:hypothetical protein
MARQSNFFWISLIIYLALFGLELAYFIVMLTYLNDVKKYPQCEQIEPTKRKFIQTVTIVILVVMGLQVLLGVGGFLLYGPKKSNLLNVGKRPGALSKLVSI